jgi:hypothetical protein
MPDGTVGVAQVFPGKLVKLALDGTPAGVFQPRFGDAEAGGFLVLVNCLSSGGNLVLSGIDISFDQSTLTQTRRYFLTSFGPEEKPVAEYHSETRLWEFQNFTLREDENDFLWGRVDVAPDGRVAAVIPRDKYEITIFDPDGQAERVIERPYEHFKRNARGETRAKATLEGQIRQFPPNTPYEMAEFEPDVMSLAVRDDGTIWAVNSHDFWEPEPGVIKTYDVFDQAGKYVKKVNVRGDGTPWTDVLIFAKGGLVFQVTGFYDALVAATGGLSTESDEAEEPEPMQVICYKVSGES